MPLRLLVAHPFADVYGSDLQLVETLRGLTDWDVTTIVPTDGPLVPLLRATGSEVAIAPFPVLRKSLLRPRPLAGFAVDSVVGVGRMTRLLRAARPDRLLVNTMTLPHWLLAARRAGVPSIAHVHEGESELPALARTVLAAPLLAADRIVANSTTSRDILVDALPALDARICVIHNGVPGPDEPPAPPRRRSPGDPARLAFVGRLSERKGPQVALAALARLRAEGRDVRLDLAGTAVAGKEGFSEELRERAAQPDLAGAVTFHGYVRPTWDFLAEADVVLVPSLQEPFGNVAAEALVAQRPLVASGVQGLAEIVRDEQTGLLVAPGDADALACAIARLLDDPAFAATLAAAGRADVLERFAPERYWQRMRAELAR